MKKNFKRLYTAAITLCLCAGLVQLPSIQSEAKAAAKVTTATMTVNDGGDFVKGVSSVNVTFKVKGNSKVTVNIVNGSGKIVYNKSYAACKSGRKYTFKWTGKNKKGKNVKSGMYYAKVIAGKSVKKSKGIRFYAKNDFAGGNGSKKKPYLVSNVKQFSMLTAHNGRYFKQTKNIDFLTSKFSPRFPEDNPFSGTYDGNGKTISNIMYSSDEDFAIGLFNVIGKKGVVKNLTLKDSSIRAKYYAGGIAGVNNGKIIKCNAVGVNTTVRTEGSGAIAGVNKLLIQDCTVKQSTVSAQFYSGLVTGINESVVRGCKVYSSSSSAWRAGGIVGSNSSVVDECVLYYCQVKALGGVNCEAGGIASYNTGTIKNCTVDYNDDAIESDMYAGGICGDNDGTMLNNVNNGTLKDAGNK